ncbi:MAG: hypothetical protein CL846_08440 [Crocinitomicaceae bacterium]|nr:hypothetical protein [Crocinitomicaceae bacterium]|tara:strand:- start:9019 stop:9948 length:930 start_codon:yes stop_codon:yes gene_type:complete
MKKKIFNIKILFIALIISSCKNEKSNPEAKIDETQNSLEVLLRVNLNEGDEIRFEFTANQDINVAGQQVQQIIGTGYTFEVLQKEGTSAIIKNIYDWMQYDISSDPKMSYDSRKGTQTGIIADMFNGMIGQSFTMKLSEKGEVTDVTGAENIFESMMKNIDPELRSQMEAFMEGRYDAESMKSSIEQMVNIYPENPVKVGDSWTQKIKLESGGYPMILNSKYTVTEIKQDEVLLYAEGLIYSEDGASIKNAGMEIGINLEGSQTGNITINLQTGLAKKGEMHQKIEGTMEIMGQTMNMNIDSEVLIISK